MIDKMISLLLNIGLILINGFMFYELSQNSDILVILGSFALSLVSLLFICVKDKYSPLIMNVLGLFYLAHGLKLLSNYLDLQNHIEYSVIWMIIFGLLTVYSVAFKSMVKSNFTSIVYSIMTFMFYFSIINVISDFMDKKLFLFFFSTFVLSSAHLMEIPSSQLTSGIVKQIQLFYLKILSLIGFGNVSPQSNSNLVYYVFSSILILYPFPSSDIGTLIYFVGLSLFFGFMILLNNLRIAIRLGFFISLIMMCFNLFSSLSFDNSYVVLIAGSILVGLALSLKKIISKFKTLNIEKFNEYRLETPEIKKSSKIPKV